MISCIKNDGSLKELDVQLSGKQLPIAKYASPSSRVEITKQSHVLDRLRKKKIAL